MKELNAARAAQIAAMVTQDFYADRLDLSSRSASDEGTWAGMPEVKAVKYLRTLQTPHRTIRLFLTFVAAMNRPRDAALLWDNSTRLLAHHPELFEPVEASAVPLAALRKTLMEFRVSLRHKPESAAWHDIACSLREPDDPVARAVNEGIGNAAELLEHLRSSADGRARFPLLRGPKIGPMWLRMLVAPGGAAIANMNILPVAVDVNVRRATKNLGVADPANLSVAAARRLIQGAWQAAVARANIGGPTGITGTSAALDPALWAYGKFGCGHCEKQSRPVPIGQACAHCQLLASCDL